MKTYWISHDECSGQQQCMPLCHTRWVLWWMWQLRWEDNTWIVRVCTQKFIFIMYGSITDVCRHSRYSITCITYAFPHAPTCLQVAWMTTSAHVVESALDVIVYVAAGKEWPACHRIVSWNVFSFTVIQKIVKVRFSSQRKGDHFSLHTDIDFYYDYEDEETTDNERSDRLPTAIIITIPIVTCATVIILVAICTVILALYWKFKIKLVREM